MLSLSQVHRMNQKMRFKLPSSQARMCKIKAKNYAIQSEKKSKRLLIAIVIGGTSGYLLNTMHLLPPVIWIKELENLLLVNFVILCASLLMRLYVKIERNIPPRLCVAIFMEYRCTSANTRLIGNYWTQ